MKNLALFTIFLLCSCSSPKVIEIPSPGYPPDMLQNGFGPTAVTNSLVFFTQNNPWYFDNEQAFSIKEDGVLLYLAEYNRVSGDFSISYTRTPFEECENLSSHSEELKSKFYQYAADPELQRFERARRDEISRSRILHSADITVLEFNENSEIVIENRRFDAGDELARLSAIVQNTALQCSE